MARTKNQKILRYSLFAAAGLALAAILSYAFVIRPLQIRQQKANFDKAEAQIDALAKQIEATIGKPDQTKKEKSCGRANLKSEKGPLLCSISSYLLYKGKDAKISSEFMKNISTFSNRKIRVGSGSSAGDAFIPLSQKRGEQTFYQDFHQESQPSCSFTYSYPGTDREFDVSGENFEIGMICGSKALSELFPMKG